MKKKVTRRQFVKAGSAATAAAALTGVRPVHALSRQNAPTLKIGLVGCGGRGTGAAENCMDSSTNVQLTAMGDMFEGRLNQSRKQLKHVEGYKVQDEHCYIGFDAYKKVIASGVDLVLFATPPGFRPMHVAAAIEAGKHVFMEKPVAVDPVGVRKVIEVGEKAKKKGLAMVVGTQNRHDRGVMEFMERIHEGQIGKVLQIRSFRNSGYIWVRPRKPGQSDTEYQIQNWYYFNWLSGDHIVEQHIHLQDICNWIAQSVPETCVGVGGRIQRTAPEYGNIYDHFGLEYAYPGGLHCMHMGRQMKGCANHINVYVIGTEGTAEQRTREIKGKRPWKYVVPKGTPRSTVMEHRDLVASIRAGKPLNEARRAAESTLTSIMGRESAYTGQLIRWNEIMNSDQDLSPPAYTFRDFSMRPVPIPGRRS